MINDFLFVSGWAGYPELFPALKGKGEFLMPFVRHSEREIFERFESSEASTLIAWSTGAHMALKRWSRVVERFDRIVLLAPFLGFTDYTADKIVKLMIRGMKRDPQSVIDGFLANCGFRGTVPFDPADTESLIEGLEYLRTSRAAASHLGAEKTVLVHGEHDRIVAPLASEDIWETMPKASYMALTCGHWIADNDIIDIAFQR
ncbi:hypothetical protein [Pseudodesulfovibrio sp. zrk46]|uniref:hypothetical protein n=1 Tax=Pseudodesulfovibrio sp. zrk46 TaxID=2725288 RepID=UPI001448B05C|nr:hypothetical protein [Pseudodesulfovibrio sp. zrk46]QJB55204.1 hypothetical protein HFN16_01770 [Pseudodesulfovibrio sp. zrk46]